MPTVSSFLFRWTTKRRWKTGLDMTSDEVDLVRQYQAQVSKLSKTDPMQHYAICKEVSSDLVIVLDLLSVTGLEYRVRFDTTQNILKHLSDFVYALDTKASVPLYASRLHRTVMEAYDTVLNSDLNVLPIQDADNDES